MREMHTGKSEQSHNLVSAKKANIYTLILKKFIFSNFYSLGRCIFSKNMAS